jgi:hypothetical protein
LKNVIARDGQYAIGYAGPPLRSFAGQGFFCARNFPMSVELKGCAVSDRGL